MVNVKPKMLKKVAIFVKIIVLTQCESWKKYDINNSQSKEIPNQHFVKDDDKNSSSVESSNDSTETTMKVKQFIKFEFENVTYFQVTY